MQDRRTDEQLKSGIYLFDILEANLKQLENL